MSGVGTALYAQTPRIVLEQIASGLNQPVFLANAKDGTNRRFIIEQVGRIRVFQPGSSSSTLFLDINSRVLFGGERGLLGLAFHPQFSSNRRFFLNYTRRPDGATVIAEYHVSTGNPNVADTTETVLLTIPQPYENHNGGMIEFGPDGYLYIGMGDGGSANDPGNRAQNLTELLGKMLRIDADRPLSPPATNPFSGGIPGRDEIFAYGFRNPWRFSFDRLTGQLYVADVGQDAREEIDIVTNGGNYGWRVFEGTRCTNLGPASCTAPGFIPPIAEYTNTGSGGRCSIIGGYVYRGTQASLPYGAYVYGDLCSGEIFMLKAGVQTVLLDTAFQISSFGEDESGEVYVVNLGGSVYRLTNPDAIPTSTRLFSMADRGAFRVSTAGSGSALTTGYVRIQADQGRPLPSGFAIFGYQQGGVLVSEASVPASPLIRSGRVFAEINGPVNTGIAIANPNLQDVTVSFFFTNADGDNVGESSMTIPANQQIAAFLNQPPFNGGDSLFGTFTFASSLLVSAVALRGFTNERDEFLLTTLPVAQLDAGQNQTVTLAHFADGGGWTTEVVLLNAGDSPIGGTIQFLDRNGQTIRTSAYGIPARSATRLQTAGSGSSPQVGSVRVSGGANATAIFSYKAGSVTVTEASVPGLRLGTAFRAYVERSAALESGLAIANPSSAPVTVNLDLSRLDGSSAGLTATIDVPPNGQRALFLTEIPGFASLSTPFDGVLRITAPSPIAVTSLRGRTNQRREFLITTTIPVDESAPATSSELLFPHFADGGGYGTQFVLFGRQSSGAMYFLNRAGEAASLLVPQ